MAYLGGVGIDVDAAELVMLSNPRLLDRVAGRRLIASPEQAPDGLTPTSGAATARECSHGCART
jgi:hypothetical protein